MRCISKTERPATRWAPAHSIRLALAAAALVALATALFGLRASLSFVASGVLALATMLAVPLAFAGALAVAAALARRCSA